MSTASVANEQMSARKASAATLPKVKSSSEGGSSTKKEPTPTMAVMVRNCQKVSAQTSLPRPSSETMTISSA